jgi:transcription initiation factor IIE alpha subunit
MIFSYKKKKHHEDGFLGYTIKITIQEIKREKKKKNKKEAKIQNIKLKSFICNLRLPDI